MPTNGYSAYHDVPTCPECGEEAEWVECGECKGAGLITCICEGEGGELVCTVGGRDCELKEKSTQ